MATAKKKQKTKKKSGGVVVRGKRKECTAKASICAGKGVVRVNSMNLEAISNKYIRELISEPLKIAAELTPKVNISVVAYGGGQVGQAQAVRLAIARALVAYSDDPSLKEKMLARDKFLVSEDSRRVEPKKYLGPKARARFQKSYR
ncbi:MAG: 30S ribosomal protein S9 [Candidatus Micrarchaeia archaeon]|jgi:small subunit ribosomal protein S9